MIKDLRAIVNSYRQNQLYRQRKAFEKVQGVARYINGRKVISFCSNDYLGLAGDPRIADALQEGLTRYGVGSGASALIDGYRVAHLELEEMLAEMTNRPRALFFSTGYMANLGVMTSLLDRSSVVFEDRLNHASMLDGGILARAKLRRYPHCDVDFLARNLSPEQHCLVATDAVFSMDGDIAPLQELADLCKKKNTLFMVDDAHGFGVFSKEGGGVCAMLNLDYNQVPILVGTLGKAAGVFGAFVAGDDDLIETLIQKARSYIYTTAPPAALACAAQASIAIIRQEAWRREVLFERVAQFRSWTEQAGIACLDSPSPIQGVITGSAAAALQLSDDLFNEGIQVSAIRPPTVAADSARLRITLSSAHREEDLSHLIECLEKHYPKANSVQQTKQRSHPQ